MTELVFDFKSIAEHIKGDELMPKKKSSSPAKPCCTYCHGCGHNAYGNSCDYCGGSGEGRSEII